MNITKEDIINEVKLSGRLPQILAQTVERKLIFAEIAKRTIEISDEELQNAADRFRELNQLQTASETMRWLQEHRLTVEDLETIAEGLVANQKLIRQLFSQAQIEKYFFEHQLNYESIVMYEICLDDRDLALEIFYAIQAGEINFHAAAHKYIADPELRRRGGYNGTIDRTKLLPEISAAIAAARSPQLLKPISTSRGTHVILVEEKIPAELNPATIDRILAKLFQQWLQHHKSNLEIINLI